MRTGISKPLIFVVISVLVVALVYGSVSVFSAYALPRDPKNDGSDCDFAEGEGIGSRCCWFEVVPEGTGDPGRGGNVEQYCQTCRAVDSDGDGSQDGVDCEQKELQYLESTVPGVGEFPEGGVLDQPPPPPTGPFVPPQGGVLQQTPGEGGGLQPPTRGQEGVLPPAGVSKQPPAEQGTTEPPATEGAQPAIVEEEPAPVCPEGQVFNEESGLCVPEECPEGQVLDEDAGLCVVEEPEAEEEPEQQSQPEEQDQQQSSEEEEDSEDNTN
jgi:hypothetical protein